MKFNKLLSTVFLFCFSMSSFAAEIKVINHATKKGQLFYVVAEGAPTSYVYVAALGASWTDKTMSGNLADDAYGQYRMTQVKYCIGTAEECTPTEANIAKFKTCRLQDNTTGPANQVNAQVLVRLKKDGSCKATVN